MSGGTSGATMDDVIAALTELVDISKVSQTVAAGSQAALAFAIEDLHKTMIALPGEIALEHDAAKSSNAQHGVVAAFDRPQPVIVVGPKPLQVTIVGGLPGQSGPGQPPKPPTPKEDETGFFGRLWQRTRFGRAGANAQKSVGSLLGGKGPTGTAGLSGVAAGAARLAGPVGIVVAFASALDEGRKAVIRITDEQLSAARKLSEVSASMAVIMAHRDVQETFRDIRQGDAQAGSAGRLARAEQRRKDAAEPFQNAYNNAKNEILAVLNDRIGSTLQLISDAVALAVDNLPGLSGAIEKLKEKIRKEQEEEEKKSGSFWASDMARVEREATRIDKEARAMMEAARASSARGRVYPSGGRLS